jgi:hypothetical protein
MIQTNNRDDIPWGLVRDSWMEELAIVQRRAKVDQPQPIDADLRGTSRDAQAK